MKKWLLTCSTDGVNIDFETVILSETEPGFWDCQDIATAAGCEFWNVDRLPEADNAVIAKCGTVLFYRDSNIFQEYYYIVHDVMKDTFQEFTFSRWDGASERSAYGKAAKAYNGLVPDSEAIPLF